MQGSLGLGDVVEPVGPPFLVICMDPPWNEKGGGKIKRGADKHYPVLKVRDILRVIVSSPVWQPAKNAHLFCWTTLSSLADAVWLVDALNFRYVSHVVWVKTDKPGDGDERPVGDVSIGQYFRGEHELCLFATRGRGFACKTDDKSIRSVIHARTPRGEDGKCIHSRKPQEFYDMVERRSTGAKLEMFARRARENWTIWGNEAPGSEAPSAADDQEPGTDSSDE